MVAVSLYCTYWLYTVRVLNIALPKKIQFNFNTIQKTSSLKLIVAPLFSCYFYITTPFILFLFPLETRIAITVMCCNHISQFDNWGGKGVVMEQYGVVVFHNWDTFKFSNSSCTDPTISLSVFFLLSCLSFSLLPFLSPIPILLTLSQSGLHCGDRL